MNSLDQALSHKRFAWIGSETKAEATWVCQTCGLIEPKFWPINGHYIRQRCQCEIDEEQRLLKEKRRQDEMIFLARRTYEWLGRGWSDAPLVQKTFENFRAERQQDAYDMARMFALEPQGTLVLHGNYGTGKTHLLAAICNEIRLRLIGSHFVTAPKLFKAIQEKIQYNEDYNGIIHYASHAPLLVIDDIDKAKASEFREEIYFEIIDERTKRGLPIAISTNRLEDLANYVGGAVCSRLSIGQIAVPMNGADFRMGMEPVEGTITPIRGGN